MKLSVIIVNYNVQYFLEQCILSLQNASKNITVEIIVVDNNSTDGSCAMLRQKFPKVQLISNVKNVGFSKANNQGVDQAVGAYILILNPDTVIAEDTLEKTLNFVEKQNNLGALGVKFIDGTGNFLPETKRNIPTVRVASRKILGNSKRYYANHISENEIASVEILTGAFMLMKRHVYIKIGGFDEDYFMYGEDIDLCYKLLNKGYQNYYYGETTIIHYKGESTTKNTSYLKHFYGAMQIFYKKHFKTNSFDKFFSNLIYKILVLSKPLKKNPQNIEAPLQYNLLLIGENEDLFEKIKQKSKFKKSEISKVISENISEFDLVIFDNSMISNKEIIEYFKNKKFQNSLKRIIPRDASFYLGSDFSTSKGKVSHF
ncbi:MAG: glycosyltransferase family 2 protein [Flavobacteriaceae bacterium]|nr:glycosyltransferase family 2 protein [Flavobacteriaceae bacterium]